MKIFKWMIYVVGIVFILWIIFSVFHIGSEIVPGRIPHPRKIPDCMNTLNHIGLALKHYSLYNSDNFPDKDGVTGLELLRKNDYLADCELYTCPDSKLSPGCGGTPLKEDSVSYIYLGGFKETDNPDIPLVFDKLGNHKNGIVNFFFLNGRIVGHVREFKTYSGVIDILAKEYKYAPGDLKRLKEKAAKLDGK